jgi:mannose-6-phosphate isomerase-like protein (cupin superfamily)
MTAYTKQNLNEVEDAAPKFGLDHIGEARFARGDLDAERSGLSLQRLKPNMRQAFGHKHDGQEETYVVIAGSGRMKLGDEVVDVTALDAIRVAPDTIRCFEAGPDGLEFLAFGERPDPEQPEMIMGWWSENGSGAGSDS